MRYSTDLVLVAHRVTLPSHGYPTEQVVRLTLPDHAPMILARNKPTLLLQKFLAEP
ncbi:hypothetical protein [Microcystis aeruginosa]|uniref:hypothetical protein n=1 Tax=Microcystis TaxID=1125 RepID=UPI00232EBF03|nr:hypothetical protein [Microcystis aeruginosa]MDB9417277.1 hypothetical protein [Microcystis aeruginosa CS-556/03]